MFQSIFFRSRNMQPYAEMSGDTLAVDNEEASASAPIES